MPFDGFMIKAITEELQNNILDNKITKIYQPTSFDLLFYLRGRGENKRLLISANPTYPRIYLIEEAKKLMEEPPMFCMLLRKHLEGGIIKEITQVSMERIIHIEIATYDELGELQNLRLIFELMGKHSNIILLNLKTNTIIDSIVHVNYEISSYRQVLPGKVYSEPPKQNKINPFVVKKEDFLNLINLSNKVEDELVNNFLGVSPALAKEIVYRTQNNGEVNLDNLWRIFQAIISIHQEKKYQPILIEGKNKTDFYTISLTYLQGKEDFFPSFSKLLEIYYNKKSETNYLNQIKYDLIKVLKNEKTKTENKLEILVQEREEGLASEKYRVYGELLMSQLHLIQKGDLLAKVPNYYDEEQTIIEIPLEPNLSPLENAQKYFAKYTKAKNSISYLNEQITISKNEINYLENLLTQLEYAKLEDIKEIREELEQEGYIKQKQEGKKNKKLAKLNYEEYLSSEGITIFVGKNNKQNEYVTHKLAHSNDTWLHTKDIPGSHVIIHSPKFNDETLYEAAMLAAHYSKGKNSSNVPVDYTLIKFVKKPSGAKPGFVIYEKQKTIYVTPLEEKINMLRKK